MATSKSNSNQAGVGATFVPFGDDDSSFVPVTAKVKCEWGPPEAEFPPFIKNVLLSFEDVSPAVFHFDTTNRRYTVATIISEAGVVPVGLRPCGEGFNVGCNTDFKATIQLDDSEPFERSQQAVIGIDAEGRVKLQFQIRPYREETLPYGSKPAVAIKKPILPSRASVNITFPSSNTTIRIRQIVTK